MKTLFLTKELTGLCLAFSCARQIREDPDMKGELVPGHVVGGLSDVIVEAGAIGGQVNHAGNGFGG